MTDLDLKAKEMSWLTQVRWAGWPTFAKQRSLADHDEVASLRTVEVDRDDSVIATLGARNLSVDTYRGVGRPAASAGGQPLDRTAPLSGSRGVGRTRGTPSSSRR